jgi:hypothetical protein
MSNVQKDGTATVGSPSIPVATTASNEIPLLDLAAANSSEIKAIVDDPKNKVANALTLESSIGFAIMTLDLQGASSAKNSVLYLLMKVRSADGREASTLVVSNKAELALGKNDKGEYTIEGYWTLDRPTQPNMPYYIGLQSVVEAQGTDIKMRGNVIANFTGDGNILASFNESVCRLVVDPMTWVPQLFGDYFPGCSTEPTEQAEF